MSKLFRCTLTTVAFLSACNKAAQPVIQPPPAPSVSAIPAKITTSAGVTRMSHDAADLERAPHFTVSAQPIAELGREDDPKFEMTDAHDFAILSDGYAALVGGRTVTGVLIFDSTGKGVRIIGSRGEGPGDFSFPIGMIRLVGDTLFVPDISNARGNLIVPHTGQLTSTPLDRAVALQLQPAGILPGHRLVGYSPQLPRWTSDTVGSVLQPVSVASLNGSMLHAIDSVPGMQMASVLISQRGHETRASMPVRFGRRLAVAVWDTLVAIGRDDLGYRVQTRNGDGTLVAQLVVSRPRRAVTPAMRDAQMAVERLRISTAGEGGGGGSTMTAADQDKEIIDTPTLDSLPQFYRMFSTSNATLWIVDPLAPTDSSWTATAFALDGGIVGRLEMPGHDRPIAFGNDRFAVRHEDENGIITYRIYRLTPPS